MRTANTAVPLEAVMDLGGSYAESLRTMNAAALRGVTFQMDASVAPLIGLPPESLELLIGMAQDFNRQECLERCRRNLQNGVKYGRPNRELPENFRVEAQKWAEGRLTQREAAQNCGIPAATFSLYVQKHGIVPARDARQKGAWPLPEQWVELVKKLLREEISFDGAALRAEIPVQTFKRRLYLHRDDVRQLAPQHLLDACQAWAEKKYTSTKAAMMAGYQPKTFQTLLRVMGYERNRPGNTIKKISRNDNAQQGMSI